MNEFDVERAALAESLRNAIVQMTIRYGDSTSRVHSAAVGEREWRWHFRAADRRFQAVQRLSRALRNLAAGGAR